MKDLKAQQRECGVGFEPVLDDPLNPFVAVDYVRPYQLLTLEELIALDRNLHDAYRRAALARAGARQRQAAISGGHAA